MKRLIAFLFKHNHYNSVIEKYNTLLSLYPKAIKIWCEDYFKHQNVDEFLKIESVALNSEKVIELGQIMIEVDYIYKYDYSVLNWILRKHPHQRLSKFPLTYEDYNLIYSKRNEIYGFKKDLLIFELLNEENGEAVTRYKSLHNDIFKKEEYPTYSSRKGEFNVYAHYYNVEKFLSAKDEILKIGEILKRAHEVKEKYGNAWNISFGDKDFDTITLQELKDIDIQSFLEIHQHINKFLSKNNKIFDLIYGQSDCLLKLHKEDEKTLCKYFKNYHLNRTYEIPYHGYELYDLTIKDKEQLKCIILDSELYGKDVSFVDSYPITSFYNLRGQSNRINKNFDDVILRINQNKDAIKQYKKTNGLDEDIYIEDYIIASTEGTELFEYIEKYNKEKEIIILSKDIAAENPNGFKYIYGELDINSCDFNRLQEIIANKDVIINKENQIKEEKQRETELKKLMDCVAVWESHKNHSSLKHKWYHRYYPYREYKDENIEKMWKTWYFIWHFKNDPDAKVPPTSVQHSIAVSKAIKLVTDTLQETFGENVKKLTLVCISASTTVKNNRRFSYFSHILCRNLEMNNGFSHINITKDAVAKHMGGSGKCEKSYDKEWFKDKNIVLFDDVSTSGRSLIIEKNILESMGAHVICAITLAQTQ